ncbi:putative spermidine/putrescine transport system substrate-binding protein [Neorhizobium galegae]|uniref:extracellular solute-binding protein n=1 Tax=Neorhizobium galegae TaxID=399 RepID=UPI001AE33C24|nr:extracellular solute-binding protein [Neorhizobium galegae]MBP2561132.1 putative spermidine/putrescine transport system substrate-binding protein [Neorhizobium galegae]MDQ0134129.1 putative spermidine/putrescine transport system substrate-binding protein [Neorhizobium galegae]
MTSKLPVTRRGLLAGAAATLASPAIFTRPVFAQGKGEVIQCNFGGGVATAFKKSYGDLFTEQTGIPFKIVEVPSTETALISNVSSPIYNSSYHSYSGSMKLIKMGVTEPLKLSDFPALKDTPKSMLPMIDDDHVSGIPIQFLFYGLAFNSASAAKEDFASWNSLIDPKWKGQVTLTNPVFASLYDVPWYSRMLTGDQTKVEAGIAHYKKVSDNALTTYTSMAQNQQLLQRGDAVASAYYSSQVWILKEGGGSTVDIVIPEEGALMIPYVFVIPKNAPHMEAAIEFAKFAGTAAPQERNFANSGYIPLNSTAKIDENLLVDRMGYTREQIVSKTFNPDWGLIENGREALIKRIEAALG